MARRLKLLLMISALALSALLAASWIFWSARMPGSGVTNIPTEAISTLPAPRPLAEFTLRNDANQVFDLGNLRDRWSFVFFGFTFCPDICPTTLAMLARVRKSIIEQDLDADEFQFVFISVDPRRDTADVMERYARFFDPELVGATGSAAQLTNLARQLGAAYKVEYQEGVENYPVSHTTAVFLIDPLAQFHGILRPPFDPPAIAQRFAEIREGFSARQPD